MISLCTEIWVSSYFDCIEVCLTFVVRGAYMVVRYCDVCVQCQGFGLGLAKPSGLIIKQLYV